MFFQKSRRALLVTHPVDIKIGEYLHINPGSKLNYMCLLSGAVMYSWDHWKYSRICIYYFERRSNLELQDITIL